MSSDRYLAHLVRLAQQHAPHLLTQATSDAAGRALLANGLARLGYVVVCVQFQGDVARLAQEWVTAYARAHYVLAQALFTPFMGFKSAYMDSQSPTLILLEAESGLLAHSLARTFLPYLALISHGHKSSMAELDGLINTLMTELLANELDNVQRTELQQQLHEILVYLVKMRQSCYSYSLHTFRRDDLVATQAAAFNTQPPVGSPSITPAPVTPPPASPQQPKTGPLRSWDSSSWPPPPPPPSSGGSTESKIFMPVPDPPRKRKDN